jgi:hypothetical protein
VILSMLEKFVSQGRLTMKRSMIPRFPPRPSPSDDVIKN